MAKSKLKSKELSKQIQTKLSIMDIVSNALENGGYKIVDARSVPYKLDGATKYTIFARGTEADCKISFVSKPDKKSAYYSVVDEVLNEDLCDDEE